MKKQTTILALLLATFFLTGCYTELAVLNTSDSGYSTRNRNYDYTNQNDSGVATSRTYTTNPNAANGYYEDDQENGVFVDYSSVPASSYMGVNPDITNRELADLIVSTQNDTRNLGCDPLHFDQINCRNDFLFQPRFSFNRFSMFNQMNRFGIAGMGFGFGDPFFDPFWDLAFFGPGFGFFNDPFLSPLAFYSFNNGLFGYGPFGFGGIWGWNRNPLAWNNYAGVFIPVEPDQGLNTTNNGRSSRGSNVGRSYVRDRADSRNIPKIDDSSLRSARTSASTSNIAGIRSTYTSVNGVNRAARTPSTSRYTTSTNSSNSRSIRSYESSIGRRRYMPSNASASVARSSSVYNSNTARSTYNKNYNSTTTRSYRTGSSTYSAPRSTGSSSGSVSRSSGSRSTSSTGSSSRGSSTTRGKRGNS